MWELACLRKRWAGQPICDGQSAFAGTPAPTPDLSFSRNDPAALSVARPWRAQLTLLLLSLLIPMRQAIHIRRQQMHLVIALQLLLRRHLALAAVTDGLLQLRKA